MEQEDSTRHNVRDIRGNNGVERKLFFLLKSESSFEDKIIERTILKN